MFANTYPFYLSTVSCPNCLLPIENTLNDLKSNFIIQNFSIQDNTLTVSIDNDNQEAVYQILAHALNKIGHELTPLPQKNWHWLKGSIGVVSGLALMTVCALLNPLPFLAIAIINTVGIVGILALGAQFYKAAYKKLIATHKIGMDFLFSLSTLSVIGLTIASFFIPGLPIMLDVGLLIFGFRHLGLALEKTMINSFGLLEPLTKRAPTEVYKFPDTGEICAVSELNPGDLIIIPPDTIIPVDGICIQEESVIFDPIERSAVLPINIGKNFNLLAGMKTGSTTSLAMRVTHTAGDSNLARLDEKILEAIKQEAPIESTAQRILEQFTPLVIIIAILSALIISIFCPPLLALQCAISVLVSACPCTLGFIIPHAIKIGMRKAAANGVNFKSAEALQQSSLIDTVMLDLNGTLTAGVPQVLEDGNLAKELFGILALIEEHSPHMIAKTIVEYAKKNDILHPQIKDCEITEVKHYGLNAKIDGINYTVGNALMLQNMGFSMPINDCSLDRKIYLIREQEILGFIKIIDPVKPTAKIAIAALKAQGKNICLITGEYHQIAQDIANDLGIENIYAECTADGKADIIKQYKDNGHRVAMIGDGPNDVLAGKLCFGVAINEISDSVTKANAKAVINKDKLESISHLFEISKQTVGIVKQNLIFSMIYNVTIMCVAAGALLAVGVMLHPALGGGLMILQSSIILLNTYRLPRKSLVANDLLEKKPEISKLSFFRSEDPSSLPSIPDKKNTIFT